MKHLALLLFFTSLAHAENIGVGIRGGLPFGDAFVAVKNQNFTLSGHNRFLIGPTFELRLPMGFGFNFDALYRRYDFKSDPSGATTTIGGGQWEFPLMLRYRFPGIVARPFVAAGPIFQTITGVTSTRNTKGLALGTGVDIKVPLIHVTPEIRYSRRLQDLFITQPFSNLKANANQFDLIIGVTF